MRQLPEQKKLLALQIKIAEHQLDQYTEAQKQPQPEKIAMFKTPTTIPKNVVGSGMTTRSLTRQGTLGTQLMGHENPTFELHPMRPPTPIPTQYRAEPAVLQATDEGTANVVRQRTTSFVHSGLQPYRRPMEIPQIEPQQSAAAIPNRTPRLVAFVNRFRRNPLPNVRYNRVEDRARIIDNARDMSPPQPPIGRRVVSFLQIG